MTVVCPGVLLAPAAVALAWWLLERTPWGFAMWIAGGSLRAARRLGLELRWRTIWVLALSGALAGLAGVVQLTGVTRRLGEVISVNFAVTVRTGDHWLGLGAATLGGAAEKPRRICVAHAPHSRRHLLRSSLRVRRVRSLRCSSVPCAWGTWTPHLSPRFPSAPPPAAAMSLLHAGTSFPFEREGRG